MTCRHPRSARAIRVVDGLLVTGCWACEVEADIEAREKARVEQQRRYWREAQRASRARAKGYTVRDEYSVAIAHTVQRPASRLYSEARGVDVPEYRRNG